MSPILYGNMDASSSNAHWIADYYILARIKYYKIQLLIRLSSLRGTITQSYSCRVGFISKGTYNTNEAIEKSTKFINKIKSTQLACANRAKSVPENAIIRKEYIKC